MGFAGNSIINPDGKADKRWYNCQHQSAMEGIVAQRDCVCMPLPEPCGCTFKSVQTGALKISPECNVRRYEMATIVIRIYLHKFLTKANSTK